MRHYYSLSLIVGLLCIVLTSPVAAQWTTQSPIPTDLSVQGIAAPTPDRIFVATDDDSFDNGGALFESQDGGATWTQRNVPLNLGDPFHGVFFLDSQLGWTFGNANYRTIDGGTTWQELPFIGSTYQMEFFTPTFGAAFTSPEHWISRNGGLDWELSPNDMMAFSFADDQIGLGASQSGLYQTVDGGATFSLVHAANAYTVEFLSSSVAVAIADDKFVRSIDGGQTWTDGQAAEGRSHLTRISDDVLLAWRRQSFPGNNDGQILRSEDGGQTWVDLGTVFPEGAGSFVALTPTTVVAMDDRGNLYRSVDAGATWSLVLDVPGVAYPYYLGSTAPVFADAQTGYLALGKGYVVKSTDGGATWTQISSGYGETLNSIGRFANGDMISVGEFGTILTNRNGDALWALQGNLSSQHLKAAHFFGALDVVVADYDGHVYHSGDGGLTWSAPSNDPQLNEAYDLFFHDSDDGWVVGTSGANGALKHTIDGGTTWTTAVDTEGDPVIGLHVSIDFVGESGWVAGSSSRYYRTTDAGTTWIEGHLPTPLFGIRDMDFFDASVGYAVGSFGYAARSDDGGITWSILPTPNDEANFTDIHLVGPNELWLSTNDGLAYYTATGGQNWAVLDTETGGFAGFTGITASPEGDAWMVGYQGYIEHFQGPPPPPLNRPPVASFSFVSSGRTTTFTDESTDPDGTVVSWFWDFDDGTTSTEQHPTHTFAEEDSYFVRLTVTDDDGDTGSTARIVVAQDGPGGTFGDFTEVTPLDPLFITPQDEDFVVATTASADYDNDGDLDIAVLGFYVVYQQSVDYQLVLMRNEGEGAPDMWDLQYTDVPIGDMSTGASDLSWGDVDGDGDEDLLVGSNGETVLYRNEDGVMVATNSELPIYYEDNDQADFDLNSLSWADVDNDGDLDILMPSAYDASTFTFDTALLYNEGETESGDFAFTVADSVFADTGHAESEWADFDSDGDLDLLLVHLAPLTDLGFIRRYRNDGEGVFVGEDILGSLSVEHGEAHWADYDADGDFDILVAGNLRETDGTYTRAAIRIYENVADSFTPFDVIDCIPCEGWFDLTAATWADYDSDGDVDILLAGTHNPGTGNIEGRARIYENDGFGLFTTSGVDLPAPHSSGTRGGTFSWLDIDGEGDLDYFIAGEYFVPGGNGLVETQMHLYRNDVEGDNAAPSVPSGLQATVGGADPLTEGESVVTFSWNGSSDDSTPMGALTYDLKLQLNGEPVAAPRRLPQPGNVSAVTNWQIFGLEDGNYTWTVRAVDSAYNGSATAEGVFSVGVGTANEPNELPLVYSFEGTYPNPFSRTTTIRYALPEPAEVDLAVYDVLGRRVVQLVREARQLGFHEFRFDASELASGIYFVRFSTDAYTSTKRVTVL